MPHVHCIGEWINSTLIPRTTGQREDDGRITVDSHSGGTFTGRHHNTGASLVNTSCDGVTLTFTRITALETVTYSGRIRIMSPTLDIIEGGTFVRVKNIFDLAGHGEMLVDSGDWTAEKPT